MNSINRVLFLRTDRIGDVLMNLPAIHLLRQSFPKAWISVLVNEPVAALLKDHPDLDEVMTIEAQRIKESLRYRWDFVQKIRKARFDLAIVSNPDRNLHSISFFAGIKHRVGYRRKWPFLLTLTRPDDKARVLRHEIDSNLDLVKLVSNVPPEGQCSLPVGTAELSRISARLNSVKGAENGAVALHAGTSNPRKRWSEKGFAAVCRWVAKEGLSIILVGGPEEKGVSQAVAREADVLLNDWTGLLSLGELAALFHDRRVKALVSCDSGPVHVAWMSGTPVVALYAQDVPGSDPLRWGPRDTRSEVIHKPIREISAEEVCEKLKKILERS